MRFLLLTLTVYYLSHQTVETYVLPGPSSHTDLTSLDRLSQLRQTKAILLQLLQQINTYAHGPPDVFVDTSILVRGDNSLEKDDTRYDDRGSAGLRSEKRDMGIMPPWRELCRLAGLRNCRGYNS